MKQKSIFFSDPYTFLMLSPSVKPTSGHTWGRKGYATDLSTYPQTIPHRFSLPWRCKLSHEVRDIPFHGSRVQASAPGRRSGITAEILSGYQVQFLQKEKSKAAWQIYIVPSYVIHACFQAEKHGFHTHCCHLILWSPLFLVHSTAFPVPLPSLHLCLNSSLDLSSSHTPPFNFPQTSNNSFPPWNAH